MRLARVGLSRLTTRVGEAFLVAALCASCALSPATGSPRSGDSSDPPHDPTAASASPSPSPVFTSSIERISAALRDLMRKNSWHSGCPVPIRDLRDVHVSRWGFDGVQHMGELVVHKDFAAGIVAVMHALFDAGFPIRRMRLVDYYGADDESSMVDDNTSAFNCRKVAGTDVWSEHSYGRAVDVDPVENPYVDGSFVDPPAGKDYVDRTKQEPGMIHHGDAVWAAFAAIGWEWGGDWSSFKDYQHFSSTGK